MKYTVEEVREWAITAQAQAKVYASMKGAHERWEKLEAILTAYADLLERIEADEVAVPVYWIHDLGHWYLATKDAYDSWPTEKSKKLFTHPPAQAAHVDMPPKHGDMHDGCGGYWCDYVQAEYKKPGPITLHESNVVRYVKLGLMCDKCGVERLTAEPVAHGEPFGYIGPHEKQTMREHGHAQVLSRQLPALNITTPVYLTAQPSADPDGWVLVPREPTEAMLDAAMTREDDEPLADWGKIIPAPHAEIYKAMLAAAPQPGESA